MKKKTLALNDGYIVCCLEKEKKNSFAAEVSRKSKEDFDVIVSLAYSEESKREQDISFAENSGHTLNIKVKTLYYPDITKNHSVTIGNMLYFIVNLDYAKADGVMYFYLEEVRELAG